MPSGLYSLQQSPLLPSSFILPHTAFILTLLLTLSLYESLSNHLRKKRSYSSKTFEVFFQLKISIKLPCNFHSKDSKEFLTKMWGQFTNFIWSDHASKQNFQFLNIGVNLLISSDHASEQFFQVLKLNVLDQKLIFLLKLTI